MVPEPVEGRVAITLRVGVYISRMEILGIAMGGALGSVLRFAAHSGFKVWLGSAFPFGTIAVNLLGSFLIGLCAAGFDKNWPEIRPLVITGFLGGFTTFSAFSLENFMLFREGRIVPLAINIGLGVFGGLFLAFAGFSWGRSLCNS